VVGGGRAWPWLTTALAIVPFVLATSWIDGAIEAAHDRIALKGLDGKPTPVMIEIAGEGLAIPANMIRFRVDRRGGTVTAVDLLLLWPSLEGFSEEKSAAFRDASPAAPLIYAAISEQETRLDSTARLGPIYSRHFVGPPMAGPGHLIGRTLDGEGYRGEIVWYEPRSDRPYVVRCLAEETPEIPATCLREVNIGNRLVLRYRFNRALLGEWRAMDQGLRRLAASFRRTGPQANGILRGPR
jgi:hypothetical protein